MGIFRSVKLCFGSSSLENGDGGCHIRCKHRLTKKIFVVSSCPPLHKFDTQTCCLPGTKVGQPVICDCPPVDKQHQNCNEVEPKLDLIG